MTTRLIHGIPWNAICPSHYELTGCPSVSITYLGLGQPDESNQWFLHVPHDNGEPRMQAFASLSDAAALIAEAFR